MKHICYRLTCIVAMFLVCVIVLSITVSADTGEIEPYYATLLNFSTTLSVSPSGQSKVRGVISLISDDYTADLTTELQQWNNGNWSTIRSWKTRGTEYVESVGYWYVMLGHSYRVHASATVYDQNGKVLERATKNSATVTY